MKLLGKGCYLLLIAFSLVGLILGQISTVTVTPSLPFGPILTTSTDANDHNINTSERSGITTHSPVTTVSLPSNCTGLNISSCVPCSPGHFPNNAFLNCSCCLGGSCLAPEDCLMCPQGYYQPLAGHDACLPCSKGAYTNSTGSTACQSCESGFYANETGSKACQDCLPGYFSEVNASICESCAQGLFCNTTRCTKCTICPGGEETLSTAATECTDCQPGMYKPPNELLCRMCQTGYYQIKMGQESCNLCPERHYCPSPDVIPVLCPNDAFCPPGSTAPQYCMETFFSKSGDHCVLTPLAIFLLVIIAIFILLVIIVLIVRRKKEVKRRDPVRSPLLSKEPIPGQDARLSYGISWDSEPVYAGW
ncbi:multiple epidermal growth factor-like domains protein 9 isoform X2 [Pristis pectinata]|uniref:multiple epidermal growth factor-like domains protein 9 isoform X2 n=1 Tax=Pristis pectinata TaxID=685728 RepID=UPI00223DE313|nr:multiple epidermal growth factor-like domains protein 9 isoform X2 [Pristis pectinata]